MISSSNVITYSRVIKKQDHALWKTHAAINTEEFGSGGDYLRALGEWNQCLAKHTQTDFDTKKCYWH